MKKGREGGKSRRDRKEEMEGGKGRREGKEGREGGKRRREWKEGKETNKGTDKKDKTENGCQLPFQDPL